MKIDYPSIKNPDGLPFVRLYEFQREEAQKLKQTFEGLAAGSLRHIGLQEITSVASVDGTTLTFTLGACDQGVKQTGHRQFDFSMSSEGWLHAAGLTDSFCQQAYMYEFQWLAERARSEVELLLSPDGDW
jgi:hypothetical protein